MSKPRGPNCKRPFPSQNGVVSISDREELKEWTGGGGGGGVAKNWKGKLEKRGEWGWTKHNQRRKTQKCTGDANRRTNRGGGFSQKIEEHAGKLERTEKPRNTQTNREEKLKRCPEHAITIVFDLVSPHQVSFFVFHSPFSFALCEQHKL